MDAAHGFRRDVLVSIRPFYASRILVAAHTSTASSRSCSMPFQFGSLYDQVRKFWPNPGFTTRSLTTMGPGMSSPYKKIRPVGGEG
jgi:hypothetical protein